METYIVLLVFGEGALGTVKLAANSPFYKMVHFLKFNWVTHLLFWINNFSTENRYAYHA